MLSYNNSSFLYIYIYCSQKFDKDIDKRRTTAHITFKSLNLEKNLNFPHVPFLTGLNGIKPDPIDLYLDSRRRNLRDY